MVSLQERLKEISAGFGRDIPNDGFRILAADNVEGGINLSTDEGQEALNPLLEGIDLLILDNLSTLLPSRSETASDAWAPMQNWLLKLRRQGKSVLLIHHAGTNGRQRGTSRREDALDTVIALRRPEDYSPEQGARFEIHFEKLRNRVDAVGAMPFEARLDTFDVDGRQSIRWSCSDLKPPMLMRAAELFGEGMTVREVAATLRISKSEAGRLIEATTIDALSSIALLIAITLMYPTKRLIHVFLDNARYHHAVLVQEWLAKPGCRIKVHYIPSYCPHLDPIERLSASAAKISNTFFHTPLLAQRENRVCILIGSPKRSGRSRQGMPARKR